jgi:hypothetical protein
MVAMVTAMPESSDGGDSGARSGSCGDRDDSSDSGDSASGGVWVTDTNRGDSHGDDVSESGDVIK